MKVFRLLLDGEFYKMRESTNRLEKIKVNAVSLTLNGNEVDYVLEWLSDGLTMKVRTNFDEIPTVYKSEENFKKGEEMKVGGHSVSAIIGYINKAHFVPSEDEDGELFAYKCINSESVKVCIDNVKAYWQDGVWQKLSEEDSIYKTKGDVRFFNDYKILDDEYVEHIRKCPYSLMKFNERQRNLINEFKDLLKEMHEENIRVAYDYSCDTEKFINMENVEEIEMYCDAVDLNDGDWVPFKEYIEAGNSGIYYMDSNCCDIHVKFKTEAESEQGQQGGINNE